MLFTKKYKTCGENWKRESNSRIFEISTLPLHIQHIPQIYKQHMEATLAFFRRTNRPDQPPSLRRHRNSNIPGF